LSFERVCEPLNFRETNPTVLANRLVGDLELVKKLEESGPRNPEEQHLGGQCGFVRDVGAGFPNIELFAHGIMEDENL
jgi:hypothetical protein